MDFTGDGADLYAWTTFSSTPSGVAYVVANATSLVQDWVAGAKSNYGLVVQTGNHGIYMSEQGTADEPVLFLDYVLQKGTLTFTAGQTSKTIDINIVNDTTVEADETVVLTLSNPSGGAVLGTNTTHTYTIINND